MFPSSPSCSIFVIHVYLNETLSSQMTLIELADDMALGGELPTIAIPCNIHPILTKHWSLGYLVWPPWSNSFCSEWVVLVETVTYTVLYMLQTDLKCLTTSKPLDGFEVVWTILKPAGLFWNPPVNADSFTEVQGSHCLARCWTVLKLSALTALIL